MDHYPPEYLQHPLPVMVLTGLESAPNSKETESTSIPHPLTDSNSKKTINAVSQRIKEVLGTDLPPSAWEPGLVSNSQNVLTGRANRNFPVTGLSSLTAGSERLFSTVVYDKEFFFPPQRTKSFSGLASTHSVLSPLNPASPLHPDGLFTPLWFRRHCQGDQPGAILAFHELWQPPKEELQAAQFNQNSGDPLAIYREKDARLINEFTEMRKLSVENQTKYAVVVWNLNRSEGNDTNEDRLVQIRRASGLDARNGFFVLDRRAVDNLEDFLTSIQRALFEPSFQGYREHYRRIKRKLARISTIPPRGLPSQGWSFRYEFKLAFFSLIRQDVELALRHFEVAYCALSDMLIGGMIAVNSARWNEAVSLIDCVNFHLCRLHFYSDNPQSSLVQLNCHLMGFKKLYESFNTTSTNSMQFYHAWKARQYRLFADVYDWAIRSGKDSDTRGSSRRNVTNLFQLGSHVSWQARHPDGKRPSLLNPAALVSLTSSGPEQPTGSYPLSFLQHPGYYYYESACHLMESAKLTHEDDTQPALNNTQSIIESLSKSYEHFKRYHGDRMTLQVAYSIASSYLASKKFDLAMKFYDRIAKAYRKEPWPQLLSAALQQALFCARQLQLHDTVLRHSVELLSPGFVMKEEIRRDILSTFMDVLSENPTVSSPTKQTAAPSRFEPTVLEMEQDLKTSFLQSSTSFKGPVCYVNTPMEFQIRISAFLPTGLSKSLRASAVRIGFSDPSLDITFKDNGNFESDMKPEDEESSTLKFSDLEFQPDDPIYLYSKIVPKNVTEIKIISIKIYFISEFWEIVLPYDMSPSTSEELVPRFTPKKSFSWGTTKEMRTPGKSKEMSLQECLALRVVPPTPKLNMEISHISPAYLEEAYPVLIKLVSEESCEIKIDLQLIWGLSENNDTIHEKLPGSDPESTKVSSIPLSLAPKTEKSIETFLNFASAPGLRTLLLIARYHLPDLSDDIVLELREEISITVDMPFECSFQCSPLSGVFSGSVPKSENSSLSLLRNLTPSQLLSKRFILTSFIKPKGNLDIKKLSLQWEDLDRTPNEPVPTCVYRSFNHLNETETWEADIFRSENYILEISLPAPRVNASALLTRSSPAPLAEWNLRLGSLKIDWLRTGNELPSTFRFPIPSLRIPSFRIAVELAYPAVMLEGKPFTLTYTIANATACTEEVIIRVDASDTPIVYAGWKVAHRRLLPYALISFEVTCHALAHGRVPAPRLILERPPSDSAELPPLTDIVYGWPYDLPCLTIQPCPTLDHSELVDEGVTV